MKFRVSTWFIVMAFLLDVFGAVYGPLMGKPLTAGDCFCAFMAGMLATILLFRWVDGR